MAQKTEERRLLTILFADLPGFATLSSKVDPEEVREVVSTCFDFLHRPIVHEGGTLHKHESDLIIALFGYPGIHEDDPERATRAALQMLAVLPEVQSNLAKKLRKRVDLGLRIGINSGIVFAGEVGAKDNVEYTVMGDVVNFASRLKDFAKGGEVIVSESIFRASRYLFDYQALPPAALKGIDEPIRLFKPLRLKPKPEPKRGIKGLSSPMVGRRSEIDSLKKQVIAAAGGEKQIAFILGNAGLGKSRLVEELKAGLGDHRPSFRTIEGRCYAEDETLAYGPFLQIVRHVLGIVGTDSEEAIRQKLVGQLGSRFGRAGSEMVPYLGYLLSVRFTGELDERLKYLDAQAIKVQVFLGIKRLLTALARETPLLIVIEDFHWVDSVSAELLEYLLEGIESFPAFFLCPARLEKERDFWKAKERLKKNLGGACVEITLRPLDQSDSTALANNLLAISALPRSLQERILARAEGNPFYLEEIIRSLIDSGVIVLKDGVWVPGAAPSELDAVTLPDTVNAIITGRLDRLNRESRDVLQTASVIGRTFYVRILERLNRLDNLMLSLHLATLEEYEYVDESSRKPELAYMFKHPLLQEAVYSSILRNKRRELHRVAGEAIEEIYRNRLEDFTDMLAYQYGNSDSSVKAAEWLARAGRRAKEHYAHEEAIKYFEGLISTIKEGELDRRDEVISAHEALGEIYTLRSEYDRAAKCYQEMLDASGSAGPFWWRARKGLAAISKNQGRFDDALRILDETVGTLGGGSADDLTARAEIGLLKCGILLTKGDTRAGLEEGNAALNIVDELIPGIGDERPEPTRDDRKLRTLQASILDELAIGYRTTGQYDRAIELSERALQAAGELGDKLLAGTIMVNLGLAHYNKGDYVRAIELCQRHLKIAEEIGYKRGIIMTAGRLGMICYETGDVDRGIEYHEIALKTAEEIGDKQGIGTMNVNLGNIYRDKGEYERARRLYERGIEIFTALGAKEPKAVAIGNLGMIYEADGDYDKAIELYLAALEMSWEIGAKRRVGYGLDTLGVIHRIKGEYDKARSFLDRSLKTFEETGDRTGIAMVCSGLGGLLAESGELEDAREHLLKAEAILKETHDQFVMAGLYRRLAGFALLERSGKTAGKQKLDRDALQYAEAAMGIARELKSELEEADCHITLGEVYAAVGDNAKAEDNFNKALDLFEKMRNKKGVADTCLEFGRMLKRSSGRERTAAGFIERARAIYEELKLAHKVREADAIAQGR